MRNRRVVVGGVLAGLVALVALAQVPLAPPAPATDPAPPTAATLCPGIRNPITGLKTQEKVVAFTFDDGPSPTYTPPIMDIFEARGMRASFFLVAGGVPKRAALVQDMVARGFDVGNHSRTHHYTAAINVAEVPKAQAIIGAAAGRAPIFYRAPGLSWSRAVLNILPANGLCPIDTNAILGDWRSPRPSAATLCSRFKTWLKPGMLVILHDGGKNHASTVAALPCMLDYAIAQGYRAITLTEFLSMAGGDITNFTTKKVGKG